MTEILTSLHGKEVGLDASRYLTTPVGAKLPALFLGPSGSEVNVVPLISQDATVLATDIGAVAGTGVACTIRRYGKFFSLDFTLTAVAITHTDAAGSGSSGSIKIFDFVQGAILPLGCRTNLTLTSDTTMDVAGDMAGVFALGTDAANAGDGALSGAEVNFAATKAFTLSSNTLAVGTNLTGVGTAIDGTSTPADLYLNESGSAATSDANGVLTVSGTITVIGVFLGDD